jgi:hypothetical protein
MSPLNSSMQNLTATSPTTIAGSPLRRTPPALPGLPTRPSAPPSIQSGSRSVIPTLNTVDEKVGHTTAMRPQRDTQGTMDSPLPGRQGEGAELAGASGVARLIAEANRRAQAIGSDTASNARPSTSPKKVKEEHARGEDPSLARSLPTLPARSEAPLQNTAKSISDLSATSSQSSQVLQPPPRRDSNIQAPPRKGSLNVAMRSTPAAILPSLPDRSRSASVASTDSGKLRRLPPLMPSHAPTKHESAPMQEDIVESPVEATTAGLEVMAPEGKKPKPAVPPKPRNL